MPNYPETAVKLYTHEHIFLRKNRPKRIINPNTGHQEEILYDEVEYLCPICKHIQPAPPCNDTDYQCPKCRWIYKLYDELLVLWHPSSVGTQTPVYRPGEHPDQALPHVPNAEVDTQDGQDLERVVREYEASQGKFLGAQINEELSVWDKKIQTTVPKDVKKRR